jgi:hypothetical protein
VAEPILGRLGERDRATWTARVVLPTPPLVLPMVTITLRWLSYQNAIKITGYRYAVNVIRLA